MAEKELWVRIRANAAELDQALKKSFSTVESIGRRFESIGRQLTRSFTIPLAAAGAGLLKVGSDFEEATRQIRAGTGATGAALEGLQQSFRTVFAQVPASAAEVGKAIADVATRTGLLGAPLEQLTRQLIELGKLSGGDTDAIVRSVTRVFGDWAIATDQQSDALDYLFQVSQKTGVAVDQLADQVVRFGAPMRQMGFDFENASALIGKFEQEGVNLEVVLNSLRMGLSRMAREGVDDPAQAFAELTRRIREAGSAGEATRIAIETFGSRAGPDLAAAVREGRFELGELVDALRASEDSIVDVAEETRTFRESLVLFGHEIELAAEPLAEKLVAGLESMKPAVSRAIEALGGLVDMFVRLPESVQTGTFLMAAALGATGPLMIAVGNLIKAFAALGKAITVAISAQGLAGLAALVTPGGAIVAGIAALAAGMGFLALRGDAASRSMAELRDRLREVAREMSTMGDVELEAEAVRNAGDIRAAQAALAVKERQLADAERAASVVRAGQGAPAGFSGLGGGQGIDRLRAEIADLEERIRLLFASQQGLAGEFGRRGVTAASPVGGGGAGGGGSVGTGAFTAAEQRVADELMELADVFARASDQIASGEGGISKDLLSDLEFAARGVREYNEALDEEAEIRRKSLTTLIPMKEILAETDQMLGELGNQWGEMARGIADVMEALKHRLVESWGALAAQLVSGTRSLVDTLINAFRELMLYFIDRKFAQGKGGLLDSLARGFIQTASFASGGSFGAGTLAMVGEQGPELVQFNASGRVFNNRDTASMLRGAGGGTREVHVHAGFDLQAIDTRGMEGLLHEHAGVIAQIVRQMDREKF